MPVELSPDITPAPAVRAVLRQQGYAVLDAPGVCTLLGCDAAALPALAPSWQNLPADQYLKDGGRYRRRRHSCFVVAHDQVQQVAHRAHWQPLAYNALHGGMQRWFEPIEATTLAQPVWWPLLRALAGVCDALRCPPGAIEPRAWFVEAHQFRIDTTDGIGRPTPEGAHRDGVDLVAVFLVGREGIKGGESRVFEAQGSLGRRFTLTQPWSVLLLDDERVIHESTPIQPTLAGGYRDTLVLTYRSGAFQSE